MESSKTPGGPLKVSRRKMLTDEVLNNLVIAQRIMSRTETIDANGLIRLSRFILCISKQLGDEVVDLYPEAEEKG